MVKTKTIYKDFSDKVKNMRDFGELFDLQIEMDKKVEEQGLTVIPKIAEDVINAIKNANDEIPYIKLLMEKIFLYLKKDSEIKNQVLNELERYILKEYRQEIRSISIEFLSEYRPKHILHRLIDIARDQKEDKRIRFKALENIIKTTPETSDLFLLLEVLEQNDEELKLSAIDVFEYHKEHAPFKDIQTALLNIFLFSANLKLRCRAIELLGIFGEIDMIEHICMLPLKEAELQKSVQKMVYHIISKPRNILYLRPENFEHLIRELLIKSDYQDVEVTRSVKDDGVDVVAYREEKNILNKKHKVIVQCKRYSKNNVGAEALEQLIEKLKKHQAKEGLLITTSDFSGDAKKLAENHRYIELIARETLQMQLDKVFGKDIYCIINRN